MPETYQEIKDSIIKTISKRWGYKDTQAESHFDPLVGILLDACATELQKISHDIEDSRTRVLERLVHLLSPEVLANAIPAHAVAYAYPSEKQQLLNSTATQFYTSRKATGDEQSRNIFFVPTGNFTLSRASVTAMVSTRKAYLLKDNFQKEAVLHATGAGHHPFQNSLWLAIEQAAALPEETTFFFELRNDAHRQLFYHALNTVRFTGAEHSGPAERGYGTGIPLYGQPDPEGIVNGKTSIASRINKHINTLYAPQFITCTGLNTRHTTQAWPPEISNLYAAGDISKIKPVYCSWLRIDFPENIHIEQLADDLFISLNCFPVTNLQVIVTQHKLMDHTNIIPLGSDGFFVDLAELADTEGNALGTVYDTGEQNNIQLHYGGVGRFNEKDAHFVVQGMIQQLRDESSAYNSIGNDFMNAELKILQQSLNRLEKAISDKQALKSDTPYLVIADREKTGTSNIYIKYRATLGAAANHIKAGSSLQVYQGPDIQGNTLKLVTPTMGGRDRLSSRDKVLAYKTALLSKEKLVTEEDIASFCRMRMALGEATIYVQKGYQVNHHIAGGFSKTLDLYIQLTEPEMRRLLESGPVAFWQHDLTVSIGRNAHLLMPLRVFIQQKEK